MMRRLVLGLALAACGSSTPAAVEPPAQPPAAPPADAAVDAAPAVPDAVTSAPAWVFRYSTTQRSETWTLQHADGSALLVVASAQGEQRYVGSARPQETGLALDVSTGTAKMVLDCKREKLAVGKTCNDRKAKPIEVLSCYHADFETPMPFAPAPGVEYVVDDTCNGYRLAAP